MINNDIIQDWQKTYPCLKKVGKNSFYSKGPFFLYGFSIELLTSKTEYRVFIKLINLASSIHPENRIDKNRGAINICLSGRKGLDYNIPTKFHSQYFQDAISKLDEQLPFPFCISILYDDIVGYFLSIINGGKTALIDIPILEIEFLIHFLSFYSKEKKATYLPKELLEKINELDRARIDYFMGDYNKWVENLHDELNNPDLIVLKAQKRFGEKANDLTDIKIEFS